jgi:hypothetical protein
MNNRDDNSVPTVAEVRWAEQEGHSPSSSTQDLIHSMDSLSCRDTISIKVKPTTKVCNDWCTCACHRRSSLRSPKIFDHFFGTLYLGYHSIPMMASTCTETSCWQQKSSNTSVMYYFPKWLMARAIFLALATSAEPSVSLKIPRIVDPKQEIFSYVRNGPLREVQRLFEERKASPNDIRGDIGRSLLHVCFEIATS